MQHVGVGVDQSRGHGRAVKVDKFDVSRGLRPYLVETADRDYALACGQDGFDHAPFLVHRVDVAPVIEAVPSGVHGVPSVSAVCGFELVTESPGQ
jgi:hypothetical protein